MRATRKVIFFDAAGTLIEVRGSVGDIYGRFARQYGLEVDPEELQEGFLRAFRSQPPLAFPPDTEDDRLKILEYQWWERVAREAFAEFDFPRFEACFADLFEFFRTADAWYVFDDVIPALEGLRAAGYRLAVISNFDTRLEDLLQNLNLLRYFDAVHVSTRMGAEKPNPEIFHRALRFHEISPNEAFHVGDRIEADIDGALRAGIEAALIDRSGTSGSLHQILRLDQILFLL
jgi:putative hydrolase of the HAD superfamily